MKTSDALTFDEQLATVERVIPGLRKLLHQGSGEQRKLLLFTQDIQRPDRLFFCELFWINEVTVLTVGFQ